MRVGVSHWGFASTLNGGHWIWRGGLSHDATRDAGGFSSEKALVTCVVSCTKVGRFKAGVAESVATPSKTTPAATSHLTLW